MKRILGAFLVSILAGSAYADSFLIKNNTGYDISSLSFYMCPTESNNLNNCRPAPDVAVNLANQDVFEVSIKAPSDFPVYAATGVGITINGLKKQFTFNESAYRGFFSRNGYTQTLSYVPKLDVLYWNSGMGYIKSSSK